MVLKGGPHPLRSTSAARVQVARGHNGLLTVTTATAVTVVAVVMNT